MRKLLYALTITLLLTVNTLADDIGTLTVTNPPPTNLSVVDTLVAVAIAIPNLLK